MNCPGPVTGNAPWAVFLNRLREFALSLVLRSGVNYRVRRTANGTFLDIDPQGGGGAGVAEYRVKQVFGDYLSCVTWDGTTEGTTFISIAKQFLLRESLPTPRTELNIIYNLTYSAGPDASNRYRKKTRATDGIVETQLVSPAWAIDDVVYAISTPTSVLDRDGNAISLLMQSDSRQWTAVGNPT